MRFDVTVETLRDALANAKVTTDTSLPSYQGVYLKAVAVEDGGRLEIFSMKPEAKSLTTIPAAVHEAGEAVIRVDHMLVGLKGQKSGVLASFHLSEKLSKLCASVDGTRFKVGLLEGHDILRNGKKSIPAKAKGGSIFSAGILASVIKRAGWCADASEVYPSLISALNFVAIDEGYKVLARDGYIAVRVTVTTEQKPENMLIIREPLETFGKLLGYDHADEIVVIKGPEVDGTVREIFFRLPTQIFSAGVTSKLAPPVDSILDQPSMQPTRTVIVDRKEILVRLDRIRGFADKGRPSVNLMLVDDKLVLSTASEEGDCIESIDIAYTEDSKFKSGRAGVSVATQYLIKMLTSLESDHIVLGLRNQVSPLTISDEKNEEVNTRYVVMGVKATRVIDEDGAEASLTEEGADEDEGDADQEDQSEAEDSDAESEDEIPDGEADDEIPVSAASYA